MYRVIIRLTNGKAIHCRFPNLISATVMKRAVDELVSGVLYLDSHIVNVSQPTMPDDSVARPPNSWWCPFCGRYRRYFDYGSYKLCEVCWVSNEEYHFKRANGVQDRQDMKPFRLRRRRQLTPAERVEADRVEDKRQRRKARKTRRAIQ